MERDELYRRYQDMQAYVGWSDADAERIRCAAPLLRPHFGALIDDFYAEIQAHPEASRVITGGAEQIERLKGSLLGWIDQLMSGRYDADYVEYRWRVGRKHVEVGLDQVYTVMALSRLRTGLIRGMQESWTGELGELRAAVRALNKLLDLDLATIQDAYQTEFMARQQRNERLAAIGQVAGGVAHELRNPLNVVKTSIYYLLNARSPTPEKTREHLQRIEQHITRADAVITTLNNFVKMPVPHLVPLAVEQLVRESLERNPLPPEIEVTVDCPDGLPPVLADADQMLIALGNLVRNARDAMPEGGNLVISGHAGDHAIEVDVADTGVGIAPDQLSRIMEPLYTTKARGLGLGLAITRSILEKNQGQLRVRSQPGKGTTFTVRLPAAVL
jgi:signal transduction histidine kinase